MKFLTHGLKAHVCKYDKYSQYVIWKPHSEINNDGYLYGPGIELTVIYPTTSYVLPNEYNIGDLGWEKLFNSGYFYHTHGRCSGVGVEQNQLILFNLYQTYSIWRNVHARPEFRKYVPAMIGITYLDMIYRFGSKTVVDPSLSKIVMPLINGFHQTGLGPAPIEIKLNNRDTMMDYNKYEVKVDPNVMVEIPDYYLNYGHHGFKYEMSRMESDPVDLDSPRYWRQAELKNLDLSEIICDNQMVLF